MRQLHDYQETAVDFGLGALDDHNGVAYWLGMGVGKTAITIEVLKRLREWRSGRTLVIGPKLVAERTWPKELRKWDPGFTYDVFLEGERRATEMLLGGADIAITSRDNVQWLCNEMRARFPWDLIIVDESSSFKSPSSGRFKALKQFAHVPVIELTGTPGQHEDIWSQIFLIDEGERLGHTVSNYRGRFFEKVYQDDKPGRTKSEQKYHRYELVDGAAEAINERVQDVALSMTIDEGLPPLIENTVEVPLSTGARRAYKEMEIEYLLELEAGTVSAANAGVLSGKLRQIANGAVYVDPRAVDDEDEWSEKWAEVHSGKLDALESVMEEHGREPILVAYQFKSDWARIKKRLGDRVMHPSDRHALDAFEAGECPVLASHWGSIGHGVDGLQDGGSVTAWFGLPWSSEGYQQLNKRLYRQGQTRTSYRHHIVAERTIERRMMKQLARRGSTEREMMESVHADLRKRHASELSRTGAGSRW